MRLTRKYNDGSYGLEKVDCETEKKLGQLEDIEEELGIGLITLFKALKQGFYFKDDFGDIEHISKEIISTLTKGKFEELKKDIKNYGKTWALTKEELEHESNTNEH